MSFLKSLLRKYNRNNNETKKEKIKEKSNEISACDKWLKNIVSNPSTDHWVEIMISDFGSCSYTATNYLSDNFGLESDNTIEMFKVMVAGQCPDCNGVISGEQILYVGACQQADGYIGTQEFYHNLVNGKCPSCVSKSFNLKWIGINW